jgi:hypothetical protein
MRITSRANDLVERRLILSSSSFAPHVGRAASPFCLAASRRPRASLRLTGSIRLIGPLVLTLDACYFSACPSRDRFYCVLSTLKTG